MDGPPLSEDVAMWSSINWSSSTHDGSSVSMSSSWNDRGLPSATLRYVSRVYAHQKVRRRLSDSTTLNPLAAVGRRFLFSPMASAKCSTVPKRL